MTLRRFLRDARAGATGIAAAAVTVMAVGSAALIGDHAWLVDQRSMLKTAIDAAAVAATLEMTRRLTEQPDVSDDDLEAELKRIATRYIELNLEHLPEDRLAQARETLVVMVTPYRDRRTVDVSAEADLGGTLFSRHLPLLGSYTGPAATRADARAESVPNPVEVVLAIDISESMKNDLNGSPRRPDVDSRMDIVKRAAAELVDILDPVEDNRVAIGLVPWHQVVRLGADARGRWTANGWARYPQSRHYGVPYFCNGGNCPLPEGVDHDVAPDPPEDWAGCLDEHRLTGVRSHASLPAFVDFGDLPGESAFAQAFFPTRYGAAYQCLEAPLPGDYQYQICYDTPDKSMSQFAPSAVQWGCGHEVPSILPLTSDRAKLDDAIGGLEAVGAWTYSALGVVWGQRLLAHPWKSVWGDDVHPVDPGTETNEGTRKAIVLLTDGEDTYCGFGNTSCADSSLGVGRTEACTEAKAAGSEIYVITAMPPRRVSDDLAATLRACSSEADDPDGSYVFLNNSTPERLEAAFADIANQLLVVRRVY